MLIIGFHRCVWGLALAGLFGSFMGGMAAAQGPFVDRLYTSEDGLPGNRLRSLALDGTGMLWIGSEEGVSRFDGVRFRPFSEGAEMEWARKAVQRIFPCENGILYLATLGGGLLRWDGQRLEALQSEVPGSSASITQLLPQSDGQLIFRFGYREYLWSPSQDIVSLEGEKAVLVPQMRQQQERWARTGRSVEAEAALRLECEDGGVFSYQDGALTYLPKDGITEPLRLQSLDAGFTVTEMLETPGQGVWLATGENGLVHLLPRRVQMLASPHPAAQTAVRALTQDGSGNLWAAPTRGGLWSVSPDGNFREDALDGAFDALLALGKEDLLVFPRGGSALRRVEAAWQPAAPRPGPALRGVMCAALDSAGTWWLGGTGVTRRRAQSFVSYGPAQGLSTAPVGALACGPADALWVGTQAGEIFSLQQERFHLELDAAQSRSRPISGLWIEKNGTLWAATRGAGLRVRVEARWYALEEKSQLPDLRLTGLAIDPQGRLWLGSLTGIFSAPAEAALAAARQGESVSWAWLDRSDGLHTRECSAGGQPSVLMAADGCVYFATAQGVAKVQSAQMHWQAPPPRVRLERLLLNDDAVEQPRLGASLSSGISPCSLELGFHAASLHSGERVRYRHRLVGLESSWNERWGVGEARYRTLPPGEFSLEIQAANADGVWSPISQALRLHVSRPLWQQPGWLATLAVISAALLWACAVLVSRRKFKKRLLAAQLEHARESERTRIARDLHDELGASLTEITLLASLGADASQDAQATKEIIQSLEHKTRSAVGNLDEIVWAVNPKNDTLASFAEYAAALAVDLTEAAKMRLRLDIPSGLPAKLLKTQLRHNLFLAYREALNNAVKHSHASEVTVRLELLEKQLRLSITDNGCGFVMQEYNLSEGLKNLKSRLMEISGTVEFISAPQKGTRVVLTAPLS